MREISTLLPSAPEEEQASAHRKPNTSHLLFSRHTHCPPTPSWMAMLLCTTPPPKLTLHPPVAVVISVSDCTEQEWHTCMQLQGSAAACQSGDREQLGSREPERGWRPAKHASILQHGFFRLPELPGVRRRWQRWRVGEGVRGRSSANIYAPTHTLTSKPICIQVQSHTSTHSGTLTDSHNTPPKSHQTVRLFKWNSHICWNQAQFSLNTHQQRFFFLNKEPSKQWVETQILYYYLNEMKEDLIVMFLSSLLLFKSNWGIKK